MLVQLDPGGVAGGDQPAGEAAVLDLVIVTTQDSGGDTGLQLRLQPARLVLIQPFAIKAGPLLDLVGGAQRVGIVTAERHIELPLPPLLPRDTARRFPSAP